MLEVIAIVTSIVYYIGMILGVGDIVLMLKMRSKKKSLLTKVKEQDIGKKRIVILVPALREENVISSTIDRLATLDYPNYKVIIVTHTNDPRTAQVAKEHIRNMGYRNVEVREYSYEPMTKPSALNYAIVDMIMLREMFDIVGIVDAENWLGDKDILKRVEKLFNDPDVGALQVRIIPIYERGKLWRELIQLTACVEFADLYSLPLKNKTNIRSLLAYGKMSIKNNYTTPFLGGTGCFYSFKVIEELIRLNPNLTPFDPYDLTEDFHSSIDIIGKMTKRYKIVYDPEDHVYAYFPDTLLGRIRQATRWNVGKLISMLKINIFKLNTGWNVKFELVREFFYNSVPVFNLFALGILVASTLAKIIGVEVFRLHVWVTMAPLSYAVFSTGIQTYRTHIIYKGNKRRWVKYLIASLFNQWVIQPIANLIGYSKMICSIITKKPIKWEKTYHQKIDLYKVEGVRLKTERVKK